MNGTSTEYLLILTAVTAGVTFLLRALPFLFFGTGKRPPALVVFRRPLEKLETWRPGVRS